MEILIVRHAIAEERAEFARRESNDDLRPLTKKGRERMRQGVRGLRELIDQVDVIGTSPLIRAQQTAEILAEVFHAGPLQEVPELAPGQGPGHVTGWLAQQDAGARICLVGHEPDLSELIAWLVCGRTEGFVDLKKGAACLLSCAERPAQGSCRLHWAITPRQLRLIGKAG